MIISSCHIHKLLSMCIFATSMTGFLLRLYCFHVFTCEDVTLYFSRSRFAIILSCKFSCMCGPRRQQVASRKVCRHIAYGTNPARRPDELLPNYLLSTSAPSARIIGPTNHCARYLSRDSVAGLSGATSVSSEHLSVLEQLEGDGNKQGKGLFCYYIY